MWALPFCLAKVGEQPFIAIAAIAAIAAAHPVECGVGLIVGELVLIDTFVCLMP